MKEAAMYPSFQDEMAAARIDDLLRIAHEARRFAKADARAARSMPAWRMAIGRRLVHAGVRVGGETLLPNC